MSHLFAIFVTVVCSLSCVNAQFVDLLSMVSNSGKEYPSLATGSLVNITIDITPPDNILLAWSLFWRFNGTNLAEIEVTTSNTISSVVFSDWLYSSQVYLSVSETSTSYRGGPFTSSLVLTSLDPSFDKLNVSAVGTNDNVLFSSYPLNISDCPTSLPYSVIVKSSKSIFEASGAFACSNHEILFYSNKTKLSTNHTTCLDSGTWSGQEKLQCWKAPIVDITSNLTVIENSSLNVNCKYNNVTPLGNSSIFYFGSELGTMLPKDQMFNRLVTKEDHKKKISCQAATPYTSLYKESGKSPDYAINVLYRPYQIRNVTCQWVVHTNDSCNVLFNSNPKAEFVDLKRKGVNITAEIKNAIINYIDDDTEFTFRKSNITFADAGEYELVVNSSAFPGQNFSIFYSITVGGSSNSVPYFPFTDVIQLDSDRNKKVSRAAIYAGSGCAGLLLLVAFIVFMVKKEYIRCNRKGLKKGKNAHLTRPNVIGGEEGAENIYSFAQNVSEASGEWLDIPNPLYNPFPLEIVIESDYADIDIAGDGGGQCEVPTTSQESNVEADAQENSEKQKPMESSRASSEVPNAEESVHGSLSFAAVAVIKQKKEGKFKKQKLLKSSRALPEISEHEISIPVTSPFAATAAIKLNKEDRCEAPSTSQVMNNEDDAQGSSKRVRNTNEPGPGKVPDAYSTVKKVKDVYAEVNKDKKKGNVKKKSSGALPKVPEHEESIHAAIAHAAACAIKRKQGDSSRDVEQF